METLKIFKIFLVNTRGHFGDVEGGFPVAQLQQSLENLLILSYYNLQNWIFTRRENIAT